MLGCRRAGVSKLRAFAEIVSIEIIPQLLDALESCRQLSGGISTEQLQHSVLLDTLRYCFSQILDFALTEVSNKGCQTEHFVSKNLVGSSFQGWP